MNRFLAPLSKIAAWEPPIPRQHLYAILMLAGFSIASVTLLPSPGELMVNNSTKVERDNLSDNAALARIPANADTEFVSVPDKELLGDDTAATDGLDDNTGSDPDQQWTDYIVKGDDNLSVIFNTLNLPAKTLHKLLDVDIQNSLIRLKINQKLAFRVGDDNVLQELVIPLDNNRQVHFERKDDNYVSRVEAITATGDNSQVADNSSDEDKDLDRAAAQQMAAHKEAAKSAEIKAADSKSNSRTSKMVAADSKAADKADKSAKADVKAKAEKVAEVPKPAPKPSRVLRGNINGAFVASARNAGLTNNQIHRVASMFRGRIDFRRDLRKGDSFRVLFDKPHDDDAKILAVAFNINGREISAFRGLDGQFYDASASSFNSSGRFMRFPIPSTRKVSSGFNPSRRNPVTGRVQPHNGTDFAVHVGTPILATGDGVVAKATSHPEMGRYIVLSHGSKYTTVYMHMSKLMVKPGQKIKVGQIIGLSGNTGRTTGPHLHYEFRINSRPVDAMRVDLPMTEGLGDSQKRQFLAKVREYQRLMKQPG